MKYMRTNQNHVNIEEVQIMLSLLVHEKSEVSVYIT